MSAMDAIHERRSVRSYTEQAIDRTTVKALLNAAVLAPTAMHQEPWSFVVIQDKDVLDRLSDSTKNMIREEVKGSASPTAKQALHHVANPEFHVFYNAGTLIIICGKHTGPFVEADCWLAAENLMLAACAKGLGTCVIGFAVEALNTAEWKAELKIPSEMTVIAPIIVGVPAGETAAASRNPPDILLWKQ
jgi:nitroreductase